MGIIRTIGTGVAWNTVGAVIGKIVGFANIFLILSHLSVYEYGLTELTMSVVSTVGLFLLPGLTSIVTVDLGVEYARKNYGRMKALFLEFFTLNMGFGIIGWSILFFGSSFVAHVTGNDLIDRFFKIVSFLFLTSPLRLTSTMMATVFVRYADQSFFSVVEEVVKGLWLLIFFFIFDRGADGLLLAAVLAQVVVILCFAPRTLSAIAVFWHVQADGIEPIWKILRAHRKWGVTSSYFGTLTGNMRLWIIKAILGTEAVGLFAFATGIFGHIASLISLQPAIAPIIPHYAHDASRLGRLMSVAVKYQILISSGALLGALALMSVFVAMFFPHYIPATHLVLITLLGLIPNGLAHIATPVFVALKEQRTQFYSALIKLTSMLIVLPLAILSFGLVGAGVEFVITAVVTACERSYRLKRLIPSFILSVKSMQTTGDEERQLIRAIINKAQAHGIYPFSIR